MEKQYACWLTLNRQCNLRCKWCYAQETSYRKSDTIDLKLAYSLIDLAKSINIHHITLIGGEPTLYPSSESIIKYIHNLKMTCGIVTNGVLFSDYSFAKHYKDLGIDNIGLSLKGHSSKSFYETTKTYKYLNCLKAINNLVKLKLPFTVSIVLTPDNINSFILGVKDAIRNGAKLFSFSFEFDFNENKYVQDEDFLKVFNLISCFYKQYDELCSVTQDRFIFHQTLPLCIWDENFLNRLKEKQQLFTGCQLTQKNGIIFNTNGDLLVCNALFNYPLAKYNIDFKDKTSFKQFLNDKNTLELYERLCSAPSHICDNCRLWTKCGGGCISNWRHYSLEKLLIAHKKYHNLKFSTT